MPQTIETELPHVDRASEHPREVHDDTEENTYVDGADAPLHSRRKFLGLLGAGGVGLLAAGSLRPEATSELAGLQTDTTFESLGGIEAATGGPVNVSVAELTEQQLRVETVDAIKQRSDALRQSDVQTLARNLLDSAVHPEVTFDDRYPRVRASMEWAAEWGVFPLIDIDPSDATTPVAELDLVNSATEHVPVQKELLVTLTVLAEAGIDFQINSLATSDAHTVTSMHYRGLGLDLSVKNQALIMPLLAELSDSGVLAIDELFGTADYVEYSRDKGDKSSYFEHIPHIHIGVKEVDLMHEVVLDPGFAQTFENEATQRIADELGVTPADYFRFNADMGDELAKKSGYGNGEAELGGLFPEAVASHLPAFRAASEKHGVPIEYLMTITTIESNGDPNALSKANAYGVMQMVPRWHRERIDIARDVEFVDSAEADKDRGQFLMDNPEVAVDIGAQYLAELLAKARAANSDLNPHHPHVMAIAAAAYNEGPDAIKKPFSELPKESQLYYKFNMAYYLDCAMGRRLLQEGAAPDQLRPALRVNKHTWARFEALQQLEGFNGDYYESYKYGYDMVGVAYPGMLTSDTEPGIIGNQLGRSRVMLSLAGYKGKHAAVPRSVTPSRAFHFIHGARY